MQRNHYKTFKALGILLWYPHEEWLGGIDSLCSLIEQEKLVSDEDVKAIRAFASQLRIQDIFDVQEAYVDTFDRVRSLSLHLFEHVHGESRDRGQAMVDLAEIYKKQGFSLAKSELPDYLPVFLEYLSSLSKEEALEMLADPSHVLVALGKRLAERGSPYSAVFNCLIRLAGRVPEKVSGNLAATPLSFIQLDKDWEEKTVDFLGAEAPKAASCSSGGCGGCSCAAEKPPETTLEKMTQGART